MLEVTATIKIPLREFDFSFARGSGPGGQNVNKVNSKVILSWRVVDSPSLAPDLRERFVKAYLNKISNEGCLVIMSDKFRDQGKNQEDCLEKLRQMILKVAVPPKPRRATKPTWASQQDRLQAKKSRSVVKQQRQKKDWD